MGGFFGVVSNSDCVQDLPKLHGRQGIGHGLGYAAQAGIPFRRPFVKYTPTWARSFMPQNQAVRDLVARMKLIPIRENIAGKRLLFCEDSIVRGTQLKDTIQRLYDFGALEVHMRPACPPLVFACPFLNFSRSKSELDLAARRAIRELEGPDPGDIGEYTRAGSGKHGRMVASIAKRLNLTSLKYQKPRTWSRRSDGPRTRSAPIAGTAPTRSKRRSRAHILTRRFRMPEHPLATIQRIDPKMMDHLKEMNELIYCSGSLPKKVKLLIAMAFDAAHGADLGVKALAMAAMKEGATIEEIAEALRVAYHLSGVGTLYTASSGLKDVV